MLGVDVVGVDIDGDVGVGVDMDMDEDAWLGWEKRRGRRWIRIRIEASSATS